ncbi:hypothetical protein MDV095.5 [Gallid alphaherpesvirus 2]|uniref:Uncharacterized protein n=1 Tax=Gallid alphaherpesvirus 2 TaxID=10390 RepID=Q19B20_9ALPH|nr:hypothetical protein MDV095.5 [Gallid alphaherpesvirus 2]ACF49537.1 hypothetical protein MDV095.5 [synthetic construct]ABR13214.1 hypothetical protein MDV095.5 [Gallid alphaherpesvirus 2]ACF94827.1 hypothetical protein MDV095.5 [Gallid alphaherpesvirus 2]AEZ51789.1 hypothetical protein MDV095.5 [Gallid alphaherpesvirus 2]
MSASQRHNVCFPNPDNSDDDQSSWNGQHKSYRRSCRTFCYNDDPAISTSCRWDPLHRDVDMDSQSLQRNGNRLCMSGKCSLFYRFDIRSILHEVCG